MHYEFMIFRKEAALAGLGWFLCRSSASILVELKFGDFGFCGGIKSGEPGEKPLEQSENQQQTQPTYGSGSESNQGHIDGRQTLSLLCHPFSPENQYNCVQF